MIVFVLLWMGRSKHYCFIKSPPTHPVLVDKFLQFAQFKHYQLNSNPFQCVKKNYLLHVLSDFIFTKPRIDIQSMSCLYHPSYNALSFALSTSVYCCLFASYSFLTSLPSSPSYTPLSSHQSTPSSLSTTPQFLQSTLLNCRQCLNCMMLTVQPDDEALDRVILWHCLSLKCNYV